MCSISVSVCVSVSLTVCICVCVWLNSGNYTAELFPWPSIHLVFWDKVFLSNLGDLGLTLLQRISLNFQSSCFNLTSKDEYWSGLTLVHNNNLQYKHWNMWKTNEYQNKQKNRNWSLCGLGLCVCFVGPELRKLPDFWPKLSCLYMFLGFSSPQTISFICFQVPADSLPDVALFWGTMG